MLKDDRVTSVGVTVTPTVDGPATTYAIAIKGETDAGPFDMTLAVDDVSVELLGLGGAT